ncbi:hypothetical protein ABG768_016560, partial [Culter alburnus]
MEVIARSRIFSSLQSSGDELSWTYQPPRRALCTGRDVGERLPPALMNPVRQDLKGPKDSQAQRGQE